MNDKQGCPRSDPKNVLSDLGLTFCPGPEVFVLNLAEREIFSLSANKYGNANNSWHFHIY